MTIKSLVPLQLPADPTANLEAATKQYVDNRTGLVVTAEYIDLSVQAGGYVLTTGNSIIPFNVTNASAGLTVNASGVVTVNRAGVYHCSASIGVYRYGGTQSYGTFQLRHKRAAAVISSREVSNYMASLLDVVSIEANFDAQVGDTFEISCYSDQATMLMIQNTRAQFTCQRISGTAIGSPSGPWSMVRGTSSGFANTTWINGHNLQLTGAPVGAVIAVSAASVFHNTAANHMYTRIDGMATCTVNMNAQSLARIEAGSYVTVPTHAIVTVTGASPYVTVMIYASGTGTATVDTASHAMAWRVA